MTKGRHTKGTVVVHRMTDSVDRSATGIPCPVCSGYADKVEVTGEEESEFGCGRSGCCSRAFVCRLCHRRIVGWAEAPEMT